MTGAARPSRPAREAAPGAPLPPEILRLIEALAAADARRDYAAARDRERP